MGYLDESYRRIERVMSVLKMCDEQQDTFRTGYYMGARMFFAAACESAEMDTEHGNALLNGCRSDLDAFDAKVKQEALSLLEKMR